MLDGVRPSQTPLMLKRIIISSSPTFGKRPALSSGNESNEKTPVEALSGCAPYLQILKAGTLVFTTAVQAIGKTGAAMQSTAPTARPVTLRKNNKQALKKEACNGAKHPRLVEYHQQYLGMRPEDVVTHNKDEPIQTPTNIPTIYPIINPFVSPITIYSDIGPKYSWQQSLPKHYELYIDPFGKPDTKHSFTQEASGETILHLIQVWVHS
mmetsp:Transcript_25518/g.46940  ORF Transcript_25518/g.46940 Transcript_25518/m.46940 type:complete len:210 (+) Transcript_25518:136-765(+)